MTDARERMARALAVEAVGTDSYQMLKDCGFISLAAGALAVARELVKEAVPMQAGKRPGNAGRTPEQFNAAKNAAVRAQGHNAALKRALQALGGEP